MVRRPAEPPFHSIPFELREIIFSFCTQSTLAALSRTAKAIYPQAMAMLYDTISLHDSRWEELLRCVWTLVTFPSKARLVRTLVVTVAEYEDTGLPSEDPEKHFAALMSYLDLALRHMPSLRVLSVWGPEEYDVTKIELAVRRGNFELDRLYISGLKDFPKLLTSQRKLDAVCLWDHSTYGKDSFEREFPLYTSFMQCKQAILATDSEEKPSIPVFFGLLHYDEPEGCNVRELTLFDYPSEEGPVDRRTGVPDIQVTPRNFWHINARNSVVDRVIQQDLRREWKRATNRDKPPTDHLNLLLPDFSSSSTLKAARLLELCKALGYSYRPSVDLFLRIVQPFEFPNEIPPLISAFQELFQVCAIHGFVYLMEFEFDIDAEGRNASPRTMEMAEILLRAAAARGLDRGDIEVFNFAGRHFLLSHRNEGLGPTRELTWYCPN